MISDWYLDPPDEPDWPECPNCNDGIGEYLYDGKNDKDEPTQIYSCTECGYQWSTVVPPDPEPSDFDASDISYNAVLAPKCPHGNEWGECSACDHEGDLAYDAARERRIFGR